MPQTLFFLLNTLQNYKKIIDETGCISPERDLDFNYEKYNTGSDPITFEVDPQVVNDEIQSYESSIVEFFDVKTLVINECDLLADFFATLENRVDNLSKVDKQKKDPADSLSSYKPLAISKYLDLEFISSALSTALFQVENGIYRSDLGPFLILLSEILNRSDGKSAANDKTDDSANKSILNEQIQSLKENFLKEKTSLFNKNGLRMFCFAKDQYDDFYKLIQKLLEYTDNLIRIMPYFKEYEKLYNEMHGEGKSLSEKKELRKKLNTLELELIPEIVKFLTAFLTQNSKLFYDSTIIIRSHLFKFFKACFKKDILDFNIEHERKRINEIPLEEITPGLDAFRGLHGDSKVFIKLWLKEHIISKKTASEDPYKDLKIARVDLDQLRDAYIIMEGSKGHIKRLYLLERLKKNYESEKVDSQS